AANPENCRSEVAPLTAPTATRLWSRYRRRQFAPAPRRARTGATTQSLTIRTQVVASSVFAVGRKVVQVVAALIPLPTVLPHQRHKAHRCDFLGVEFVAVTGEHVKSLLIAIAERNQDSSSLGQLLVIRRRDLGSAGTNEYSIVRRILSPTERSIAEEEGNVARSNLLNRLARFVQQRRNPFDRKNLSGQLRQ